MSEERMRELLQDGLARHGIDDALLAVGQFAPRGSSGARFAAGMIGDTVGGELGDLGSAVGVGVGVLAGGEAAAEASGLPRSMLVGVSATSVYGMHAATRHSEPDRLLFAVPRSNLTVHVHQRGMVRVLELVDDATGSRIELEGNRVPLTHSKDVIDHLRGPGTAQQ